MILRRFTDQGRRARAAAGAPEGPVRTFLTTPPPGPETHCTTLPLLAIDVETTGLDPARDHILSVGFVPLNGLEVDLAGAARFLRGPDVEVGQSATIHGITDDALATGLPLADLVAAVCHAARGRALLAHHAVIETEFLSRACQQTFGVALPFVAVDTMELQRRVLAPGSDSGEVPSGSLRLWTARRHFGLPVYDAHEALTDALACAELYLAQVDALSGGVGMTLKSLRR